MGVDGGMDARRTLAFLEGLGGAPGLCLLEGGKRGCGGAERHMVATEWGKEYTRWQERKRERERSDMRNAELFRGRKTTQLREITMESEEEGRGPPCHHWNL